MKVWLLNILFIVSCSDSYKLSVDVEQTQKMFFVFNNDTTYPTQSFTKEWIPNSDRFIVSKIKYSPIKKWNTSRETSTENAWGQASIRVKITKTSGFLSSEERIFEGEIAHFYNPNIQNLSQVEQKKIERINPDLDSGLGNGQQTNAFTWGSFSDTVLKETLKTETNYRHTLIVKHSPNIQNNTDFPELKTLHQRFITSKTQLFTPNLAKASLIFPFDSTTYKILSDY